MKSVIQINEAHMVMMIEQKIVNRLTGSKLLQALRELNTEMKLKPWLEDIHVAIEEEVFKRVGSEIGGNLHIGKSRNDQVSTAIRIVMRDDLIDLIALVIMLQETLINLAKKHIKTLFPGYTHLRTAQPVTFAHYTLSYVDALERDIHRLKENYQRIDVCPMGAGALATTSFAIDREKMADLLGFRGVLENSIDAVSSRDFVLETLANLTILAVNISRLTEDLIVWSTPDFDLVKLPDNFSSTSSIMPQKKNPDVLEVIRARMGQMLGNFVTSVTVMKSLPSGYNLDFQEITPLLWRSFDTIKSSLIILSKLVVQLKVSKDVFNRSFRSFSTSTELANILVRKYNLPFRTSHRIVGALVRNLIEKNLNFSAVTPELLQSTAKNASGISLKVEIEDIKAVLDPQKFVEVHNTQGGPSPHITKKMIRSREDGLKKLKARLSEKKSGLETAQKKLGSLVKSYSTFNGQSPKLKNPRMEVRKGT